MPAIATDQCYGIFSMKVCFTSAHALTKRSSFWLRAWLLGAIAMGIASGCNTSHAEPAKPVAAASARWESQVRSLERRNSRAPKGGVLFIGSSSIRLWSSLKDDMAPVSTIRSGFGGATSSDVLRYAKRLVLPHAPRAVVYYAGDNDLGRAKVLNPTQIRENFQHFVASVRESGQQPDFYFVSIKPSPKRMKQWPRMKAANQLVDALAQSDKRIHYIDVASAMLDEHGRVRAELFRKDGLHMNERGYALWTATIQPLLQSRVGPNPLYL